MPLDKGDASSGPIVKDTFLLKDVFNAKKNHKELVGFIAKVITKSSHLKQKDKLAQVQGIIAALQKERSDLSLLRDDLYTYYLSLWNDFYSYLCDFCREISSDDFEHHEQLTLYQKVAQKHLLQIVHSIGRKESIKVLLDKLSEGRLCLVHSAKSLLSINWLNSCAFDAIEDMTICLDQLFCLSFLDFSAIFWLREANKKFYQSCSSVCSLQNRTRH